jgi:MtN3 and saliva related transmembrane protein
MDIIGYIATILLNTALIWQNIKSWKTKSTNDLSIWWTVQFCAGLLLFVVYGFKIKSYPIAIGCGFEFILTLSVMLAKIKYR